MIAEQRPRDKARQELGKSPEDREHCKEVLVGPRQEFEKDGRVNRQVSSDANTPQSRKAANCCEVGRTSCNEAKDRGNADCKVERPSTAEEVACISQFSLGHTVVLSSIHPKPQNIAPTSSPIFCDNERSGGSEGENSLVIAGRIKDVTMGQRLSLAQPNPSPWVSMSGQRRGSC